MNLYYKHWLPKDCDAELITVYGVRFARHAADPKRKYKAWYIDFVSPSGIRCLTFTTSHKSYYDFWKKEWSWQAGNWQLFGKENKRSDAPYKVEKY